jgi:hypothetical protein
MAIQFRETKSRFKGRPLFLGLNTSPVPLVAAAVFSIISLTASFTNNPGMSLPVRLLICFAPTYLTVGYIWAFKTGRRPSFDRDLLMCVMNGKVASPTPSEKQPLHPGIRGVLGSPKRRFEKQSPSKV